ncbi:hypothetical protein CRENBAI_016680 [Crenichthys baileyi]|uniref:Uncharacterized protein n=1 Tax=Crenichthys baileyi TaxID=28760 RepID=A0AAV9RJW3_9TELE
MSTEWKGTPRTQSCFCRRPCSEPEFAFDRRHFTVLLLSRVSFSFLEPANPQKALTSPPDHLLARHLPVHPPTSQTPSGRKLEATITTSPQPHLSNSVTVALLTFPQKLHFLLTMPQPAEPR